MDSMHQSWLPRVVAAAFPSGGSANTLGLVQRKQSQALTAARYRLLPFLCPSP